MNLYTLALFAHILGVLGVFVGNALDWTTILRLRRTQAASLVCDVTGLVGFQARLIQISSLVLLVAGIYMTEVAWEWHTPWVLLSLAALIVMGGLSGGAHGRRLAAIRKAAAEAPGGPIPPALQRQMADPVLLTSVQTAGMIGLGVVFLMTTKPDLGGSLITLGVAVVLGVLSAPPWRRPRASGALAREARSGS